MSRTLLFFALALFACGASAALSGDTFDDAVAGKNAFIKFFAPWCGHCKRMAGDWSKLENDFAESKHVAVAEVDCTQEQELCSKYGVSGYPTLKYKKVEGEEWEAYNQAREYDTMKKFVEDELAPPCTLDARDNCSERQIKFIEVMEPKSADDKQKQLERLQSMANAKAKPELVAWIHARINLLKQMV